MQKLVSYDYVAQSIIIRTQTITRNINFIKKRGQLIDYYNALGHIQYPIFIVELIN